MAAQKHGKQSDKKHKHTWLSYLAGLLLIAPCYATGNLPPQEISRAISEVLSDPLAVQAPALLPVAKALLTLAMLSPLLLRGDKARKALYAYYTAILVAVGFLQNMSHTADYGFVWVVGNTAIQLLVAAGFIRALACEHDGWDLELHPERLWLVAPMALALVEPYTAAANGTLVFAFDASILANDTGVTYCMITPVVLGTMLIWGMEVGAGSSAISFASYVGLLFGILNLVTWFVFDPASWWMGVLHLPLVIVSVAGLACCRRARNFAINS
ncbi:MAG: hypothetical protein UHI81_00435 [Olegusella sp.]|nr:hypothetical protein [Olegusella sp.]